MKTINPSDLKSMFTRDAIVAGYGIMASTWRNGVARLIGPTVGETGMNVASIAMGTGLSLVENPHLKAMGGALRIGSLARMGNNLVENVIGRAKDEKNSK